VFRVSFENVGFENSTFPRVEEAKPHRTSSLETEVTSLFDELRNPLLRYLLSFGVAPHEGEEIVQDVFLSLFQHLRDGKPRLNLRGWVFRVAHNLGLKRRYANRLIHPISVAFDEYEDSRLDPDPNPEERLAGIQRQERLMAVVCALPEQERRCLHLRAEGLRYRQIADVLGISVGGVALLLERSLKRLGRVDGRSL
jgi:RNA polymerase sigma-70 factor, ECF subfamily